MYGSFKNTVFKENIQVLHIFKNILQYLSLSVRYVIDNIKTFFRKVLSNYNSSSLPHLVGL